MTPETTFKDESTVRISRSEYLKLLEYKAICQDIYAQFKGDNNEL